MPIYIDKITKMLKHEFSILASSNPANGSRNLSPDGSRFEIALQDQLHIPKNAYNIQVSVPLSTIWWLIPNISTGVNDKMYVSGPDISDVIQNYVITIPQGLYDLSGLQNAILIELENQGAKTSPDPLILLLADNSTQKVQIRFNYTTVSIDFTQNDTFRDILGFNSQILGPYNPIQTITADETANFNQVNSFLIHSDLVNTGIRINNTYAQIISEVPINVLPGSQINYEPQNPAKIPSNELRGISRSKILMWLTDDQNRSVNTNGEYWTSRIVISYQTPFDEAKQ